MEGKMGITIRWYQYLQLQHLYGAFNLDVNLKMPLTEFEKLIQKSEGRNKGIISSLYSMLAEGSTSKTLSYQTKWNIDCDNSLTKEMWETVWTSKEFTSSIRQVRHQAFKIVSRWYITPKSLAHITPSIGPKCWKGCDDIGTYLHTWVTCPYLGKFWNGVIEVIQSLTNEKLNLDVKHLVLNQYETEIEDTYKLKMIALLLSGAKATIARVWKTKELPKLSTWRNKVWELYKMDRLKFNLTQAPQHNAITRFKRLWQPILSYLAEQGVVPTKLYDDYM